MLDYQRIRFIKSVYKKSQLPAPEYPEIAFAGRSNVGKSSLINRLVNRRNLVKVSAKPGKTQSLNYFLVDERLYLVDLPGYGFARVPKKMQEEWGALISFYLEHRETLRCVVVIIDLRHALKAQDRELVDWLRGKNIRFLPVYTKCDKVSGNERRKLAAGLDAALNITAEARVLFSSRTGAGKEKLIENLDRIVE